MNKNIVILVLAVLLLASLFFSGFLIRKNEPKINNTPLMGGCRSLGGHVICY